MRICVYGSASSTLAPIYYESARALGQEMARRGHGLVFGGSGAGLMGAVADGVAAQGQEIIGVVPALFQVDGFYYPGCTRVDKVADMSARKHRMEELADAFVALPGGIGTCDEFFETLVLRTLGQLGEQSKPIALLNTNGFYAPLRAMLDHMVAEGFLSAQKNAVYGLFDTPAALLDYLERERVK